MRIMHSLLKAGFAGAAAVFLLALATAPFLHSAHFPSARAADPDPLVAITMDGVHAAPGALVLPVGSEQDFALLRVQPPAGMASAGQMLWTLAGDGVVRMTTAADASLAAVTADAPGEAVLTASSPDGAADQIRLRFSDADVPVVAVPSAETDADLDGLPDDPFGLLLAHGDFWQASGVRTVLVAGLSGFDAFGETSPGLTVALPDQEAAVEVPEGLLSTWEEGILVVAAADTLEALALPGVAPLSTASLTKGGQFLLVTVLASYDGGVSFAPIDSARLAERPLKVTVQGLSGTEVEFVGLPAWVEDTDSGAGVQALLRAESQAAWAPLAPAVILKDGAGVLQLAQSAVIAPVPDRSAAAFIAAGESLAEVLNAQASPAVGDAAATMDVATAESAVPRPADAAVLRVDGVTPGSAYVFGGVARIAGSGFQAGTRVFFGAGEAEVQPAESTPEGIQVLVPALVLNDTAPWTLDVPVTVVNPDGTRAESAEPFTYIRVEQATADAGAKSCTTAFQFDAATGSGARQVALGQAETATITVPSLAPDVTGTVEALVTAARTAAPLEGLPGEPINALWTFDIRLFTGGTDAVALQPALSVAVNPITLQFPTTNADSLPLLTAETVQTGGLACYRLDGAAHYQWQVGMEDVWPVIRPGTNGEVGIRKVTVRLDGTGLVALRQNAFPPQDIVGATHYDLAPDSPTSGPSDGGTEVVIQGRGLAWPEKVTFGGVVAYERDGGLDDRLIAASDTELRVLSPGIQGQGGATAATIVVTLPQGAQKNDKTVQVAKQFDFTQEELITAILTALIGVPIALIGLFAGGKSGGGGGGPCFIATAAYGTPLAEHIDVLRAFRDTVLLKSAAGAGVVDLYYTVSPPIADMVASHPVLAGIVRLILWPVVMLTRMVMAMPHVCAAVFLTAMAWQFLRTRPRRQV